MSPMKITVETFTRELAKEIIPLGQQSWDECSVIKKDTCAYHGQRGLSIDPNIDQYLRLAAHSSLIAMTLRNDKSILCGYALLITYYSLHLKNELCGNVDTFYVQPKSRQCMSRFMSNIEDEFNSRGVSIIGWPVTRAGGLYRILKRRGYIADDVVMELKLRDIQGDKKLCVALAAAGVAAAGAVGGAVISSSGASSAANTQAQAAQNASAAQIYQTNAAINEQNALTSFEANLNNPNRVSGNYAQQALEYSLGLPQTNLQFSSAPDGSIISGNNLLNFGGPNSVQQQTGGYGGQAYNTGATSGQQLIPGSGQQAATPVAVGPGSPGAQQVQAGAGAPVGQGANPLGGLFQPFSYSAGQYQQSPGYQFDLGQGLQSIENSAAARGMAQSPNTQKALASYAEGLANQDYQQAYSNAYQAYTQNQSNTLNTLSSQAGYGNTATANIGSAAGNAATNISNLQSSLGSALGSNIIGAGNAQAAGQIGVGNAITGGLSNLSNTLTQGINSYFQPSSGTGYGFTMPSGGGSSGVSYGLGSGLNYNLNQ